MLNIHLHCTKTRFSIFNILPSHLHKRILQMERKNITLSFQQRSLVAKWKIFNDRGVIACETKLLNLRTAERDMSQRFSVSKCLSQTTCHLCHRATLWVIDHDVLKCMIWFESQRMRNLLRKHHIYVYSIYWIKDVCYVTFPILCGLHRN